MEQKHLLLLGGILLIIVCALFTFTVYYMRCQPVIHVTAGCPNIPASKYTDTPVGKCLLECDQNSDACYNRCNAKDDLCIGNCYQQKAACYMQCLSSNATESFTPPTSDCASCKGPPPS